MTALSVLVSLAFWGGIAWFIVSRVRRGHGAALPPSRNIHLPQPTGLPSHGPGRITESSPLRSDDGVRHDNHDAP